MNADRFDGLARVVSRAHSRRDLLRAAVGGAVAATIAGPAPRLASAQAATPGAGAGATPCSTTTPAENATLAERYWAEVWTAGGEAAVAELLTEDELHHWGLGGDTTGHAAFTERLSGFLSAFPDIRFTVDQSVAEGDLVATQWTATGTHLGLFFGNAPTNRTFEYTGVNVFRFACGKIAESWGEADHVGLRRQLGILPAAPTTNAPAAESATASPAADCPTTSAEQTTALARRFFEDATDPTDLSFLDEILTEEAVVHSAIMPDGRGIAAKEASFGALWAGFPDLRWTVETAITEGELVALRWFATGTHGGEFQGVAATGAQVTWTGITVFRIECGRIAELWIEADELGLRQQIGALPLAATPTP